MKTPNDISLSDFIHKTHFRTFAKIMPRVKEKFGDKYTEQDVKDVIASFVKDPPNLDQRKYYNKIFSDHLHAWMMDILDNGGQTPIYNNKAEKEENEMSKPVVYYWLMFINVNTRFACAYPIQRKKIDDVFDELQKFVSEHKCVSITSDKEAAFTSQRITNYLKRKDISQYIVLDGNHTSLAIIDSFIRHLRDMNITNEKSKYQSHHSKYRNFSPHRMFELLEEYNNTIHTTTHMKPIDMENDEKKERQYIAFQLIRRSKMKNHDIPNGHFVRIVLSKDAMKKMRFKVSREAYKIIGREGKNYIVSAEDETTTTLPRHRLIDLGPHLPNKYKFAETMPEGYFRPTSIINKDGEKYLVAYGDNGAGLMRKLELRRHHPQIKSKLEKEYHKPTTIKVRVPRNYSHVRINLNHE